MRAQPSDYELVRPGSLAGVLALLAEQPGAWTPIAGGTELMVQCNAGRLRARRLVDIFGLAELSAIASTEIELSIGAGVTYTALRKHSLVADEFPLLARAAGWTGAVANQNRGTLGGNLVNGSPAADSPPALLAYGAEVSLVSVRGVRRVAYAEFHTGYKTSVLAPDELLLAVHLPRIFGTYRHYLRKVGARNAQAISKVALGAVARVSAGRVQDCRLGLASVASIPFRCRATETELNGHALSAALAERARAALLAEIAPLDDIRSTGRYRAQVAGNLLVEFLSQLQAGEDTPLAAFERLDAQAAETRLLDCCGARRWAGEIAQARPYGSLERLLAAASEIWFGLDEDDWLQAFACHPRIGERAAPASASPGFTGHSHIEQAMAQASLDAVGKDLAEGNRLYEERFGFRYLVFASGRGAPELLALLRARLARTREEELQEAARQQDSITRLRLTRWLAPEGETTR